MKVYSKKLRKARRWLSSGQPTKALRYLEPMVPLFLEDPVYYALLGRACLESGLLKDAETYLNRGLQADSKHLDIRLNLAVTHLKCKNPAGAVRNWLAVLDDYPKQKNAIRGLAKLKKIPDQKKQDQFLARFNTKYFLPRVSFPWLGVLLSSILALLILLILFYFREPLVTGIKSFSWGQKSRPGSEIITMQRGETLSDMREEALFPMDEESTRKTLRQALRHFNAYQDNQARHELNKIKYSNAKRSLRDQANVLMKILGEPTLDSLIHSYPYQEVFASPWLYEGCWVLWRGQTANSVYGEDSLSFDLLIGFEEGKILEGRVPVQVPFLTVLEPLPVEILAQIALSEDNFTLVAKTVHFLR